MDQDLKKRFKNSKKASKSSFFRLSCICKPLDQLPAKSVKISTANEIQLGSFTGKAGGLYIKK